MEKCNGVFKGLLALGLLLAIGIATAGYFASNVLYKAQVGVNTAEVKGLAEREVTADQASWTIGFDVVGDSTAEMKNLYEQAEKNQGEITKLLKENGFSDAEISIGVLDYSAQEYRNENQELVDVKHVLHGEVTVQTTKVADVQKVRGKVSQLLASGIAVTNQMPIYRFTGLNAIKPAMVKEATENARVAANEFAQNAGVKVGSIKTALQGGFIIRDEGEEYGDTAKVNKTVRVVTTITFYLTD